MNYNFLILISLFIIFVSCKPNLLFVMVDDQNLVLPSESRFKNIYPSKFFKKMSNKIHFPYAHASVPICLPSRSAILFGVDGYKSNVRDNKDSYINKYPTHKSLPEHLQNNHYQVGVFGKVFHNSEGELVKKRSFENKNYKGYNYNSQQNLNFHQKIEFTESKLKTLIFGNISNGLSEDEISFRHSKRFIKNLNHSEPFALFYGAYRPHMPYLFKDHQNINRKVLLDINKDFEIHENIISESLSEQRLSINTERYNKLLDKNLLPLFREAYIKSSENSATILKKLYNLLKRKNLLENLIIVVVSDHGFNLGNNKSWGKGELTQMSLRKPMMIRLPSKIKNKFKVLDFKCNNWAPSSGLYNTILKYMELKNPEHEIENYDLVKCENRPSLSISLGSRKYYSLQNENYQYIFNHERIKKNNLPESRFTKNHLYHKDDVFNEFNLISNKTKILITELQEIFKQISSI